jgi:probable HAF family extracellular repeat protein
LYSNGVMSDLGSLHQPIGGTQAEGINNRGQVVGFYFGAAWLYTPGIGLADLNDLLTPASPFVRVSDAAAINNSGEIAGTGGINAINGGAQAFLLSGGQLIPLGTLGQGHGNAPFSTALGMNDMGQVVGWSFTPAGVSHAFLWTPGVGMTDLGTLPGDTNSFAYGVNDAGDVVGVSQAGNNSRAFLWTPAGGMIDLNTVLPTNSGWVALGAATGINDDGSIVGGGNFNGQGRGFRLDPVQPVPEPSSLALLAIGAAALAAWERVRGRHGVR